MDAGTGQDPDAKRGAVAAARNESARIGTKGRAKARGVERRLCAGRISRFPRARPSV